MPRFRVSWISRPAIAVAATARLGWARARQAFSPRSEARQRTRPIGEQPRQDGDHSFISVEGVRLRYLDTGSGAPAMVILHGNGGMIEEVVASGLVAELSQTHRVIVFDRPGFGLSERPSRRSWNPEGQASLFAATLKQLGIGQAVVIGHSWGTLVALALALEHPETTRSLVLMSGYYFPTTRLYLPLFAPMPIPFVGDMLRQTLAPKIAKAITPALLRKIFAPQPVSARFSKAYPLDLAWRPSQLRATQEETALMAPAAARLSARYKELRLPVTIIAGDADEMVDTAANSGRLHEVVAGSVLIPLPGLGHMIHYFATDTIIAAIEETARKSAEPRRNSPSISE